MRKVVFFPHSKDEFANKHRLRNWLAGTLPLDNDGIYLLKQPRGLGDLEPGSLVFFVREDAVVGCAVVEEGVRDITDEEREKNGYDSEYKKLVKFVTNSVWAWSESQFIGRKKVERIVGKSVGLRTFTTLDDLRKLLQLFAEIKSPKAVRELGSI